MKTPLAQPVVRPSDETPAIPLQMAPKRRGKPPRHFADLTPEERVASVVEAGEPAFRAKQLATHYFTHYTSDPAKMTDLPAKSRDALATTMFPELMRPTRKLEADGGTTVKTLWHLFDEAKVESVVTDLAARQRDDGGFSLRSWGQGDPADDDAASDGYAPSLATLALCKGQTGGVAKPEVRKALTWIAQHQKADGSWPGVSTNTETSRAKTFMTDAATSYATLALIECGQVKIQ